MTVIFQTEVPPNGRVELPTEVLERLGLVAGSRIDFVILRDGQCLVRAVTRSLAEFIDRPGEPQAYRALEKIEDGISLGAVEGETARPKVNAAEYILSLPPIPSSYRSKDIDADIRKAQDLALGERFAHFKGVDGT